MGNTRHMLAAAVLTVLCTVAVAGQAIYKGSTRTVAVYTTVTEAGGRLVTDLERSAFQVFDNEKPQDITVFANDVQPITVVMLLDRSGSMRANFAFVERAAEEFVKQMGPADKARIGSFSNRIQIDPRDFTSDHEELFRILHTELQQEGPTPLWNAINVGITALTHQQGRRVILVFTDGVDAPMNFSNMNNSLKNVMRRAEQENVMVYAIGLAGENGAAAHGGLGAPGGGRGRWGGPAGMGGRGGWGGGRQTRQNRGPDEGLPKIAAQTGGGYFELTSANDLASTFKRVADELHHQFVLGFTPERLDGKMHRIDVQLKDPTLVPRARKSYLARAEATPPTH